MIRGKPLVLIAVCGAVLSSDPARADIRMEEMAERLIRAADLALEGKANPSPGAMQLVRATAGLPERIRTPWGSVLLPADRQLADLEGDTTADFVRADRRLRALHSSLIEARGQHPPRGLRSDLEASAGAGQSTSSGGWLDRILEALSDAVASLTRSATQPAGLLLLLVLATVIVVAVRSLGLRVVPHVSTHPDTDASLSAREWAERARAAARAGDLTGAVSLAYRSVVAAMADRGLVADRLSLTAEEVRLAAREMNAGPSVERATHAYEGVRYGGRPASSEHVRNLLDAGREVSEG